MFDLDQFIADCRAALERAVSDPANVLRGLGEPKRAQLQSFTTLQI
jgi:hypothetical protein